MNEFYVNEGWNFLRTCCSGRATALFLKVAMLPLLGPRWRLPIREGRPAARGVLLLDGVFSLASSPRRTSEMFKIDTSFYFFQLKTFKYSSTFPTSLISDASLVVHIKWYDYYLRNIVRAVCNFTLQEKIIMFYAACYGKDHWSCSHCANIIRGHVHMTSTLRGGLEIP